MAYASNPALGADTTGTAQMLWAVGGAQASSLPPGGSWTTPATAVFPGAKPVFLGIAPTGTSDIAGWYDNGTNQITAAVHTGAGWGTPTQVAWRSGCLRAHCPGVVRPASASASILARRV
jgi:hypothetical protein